MPVEVRDEGISLNLNKVHILNLCAWYLNGDIDAFELEYAANIIELSEDFAYSKEINEVVFTLGTPEINGTITPTSVQSLVDTLRGAT